MVTHHLSTIILDTAVLVHYTVMYFVLMVDTIGLGTVQRTMTQFPDVFALSFCTDDTTPTQQQETHIRGIYKRQWKLNDCIKKYRKPLV